MLKLLPPPFTPVPGCVAIPGLRRLGSTPPLHRRVPGAAKAGSGIRMFGWSTGSVVHRLQIRFSDYQLPETQH